MEHERVDGNVFLVHWPPFVETDFVLRVEHPHLTPNSAGHQNVRFLATQVQRRPSQCVEILPKA